MRFSSSLVLMVGLLAVSPAAALVSDDRGAPDREVVAWEPAGVASRTLDPGEPTVAGAGATEFLSRYGGSWQFRVDRRTGRLTFAQGSGIALIPGPGNRLGPDVLAGLALSDGTVDAAAIEPLVRSFLESNRTLLVPAEGALELDAETSSTRANGRLHTLDFRWLVDGVEVEGAGVFVRLNSGNITQFGTSLIGGSIEATRPVLEAGQAVRAVLVHGGDEELGRLHRDPVLRLQPEEESGALSYRLVWIVSYRVPGEIETWEGRVDAVTGEIVAFRDVNRYGRVTGGVYERTVVDPEVSQPMPDVRVSLEDGAVFSDGAGAISYSGGVATSGLDGRFFTTNCQDGCQDPAQAFSRIDLGAGFLDFGFGGVDGTGNGISTPAERNAYWQANRVRRVAKRWLPSLGWLDSTIALNVNISDTCNAFWNGTANFYRAGGGCNNTGEIADVVQHEWGHGIDGQTRSGDGATGEGTADVVAIHMSHDPAIGPYFRTDGSPVRNVDKNVTSKGLLTRSNIASKCAPGTGPLGYAVHCEGEIYGQSAWDLSQALVAKHGYHTGWRTSERIFFESLPDAGSYLPEQSLPIYDAYLQADDDDGNLANGTPNSEEIYDAFNEHEIAGTLYASSPACSRPAEVQVAASADCDTIQLSWDPVAGAVTYEILRADVRLDGPFFSLGNVDSTQTSYLDTAVAPGVDYWYSVVAVAADGCESTLESPVAARLDDQPILSITAAIDDDVPRGNRSGFADPGEEVDVRLTLRNLGTVAADAVSGTVESTTPGVTVLQGFDTWPAIAAGAEAGNEGVLRFVSDDLQVACGQRLDFRLVPDEVSGCADDTSYFGVTLGTRQVEYVDDFETDDGWALDLVNSTAAAGNWVYGNPDGTPYQPEDDATADPGQFCWYTAPNAGGDGTDDVDDGVTILLSPVLDLSGLSQAILSYQRWFAQRDLGDDPDDFFRADVSSDGGATWVNLETLGANDTAGAWTRMEFALQDFIPLTSQVQLRFQASDAAGEGDLVEAALDEVRIERPVCDDTPACFVEPDFGGLQAAAPGSSCGETTLQWSAAVSNCQNAEITYAVYRDTVPGFVPGDGNRIASGLTGLTYRDILLDPGATYHYIVRAFDSRSGEDSNVAEQAVVAPISPDLEAPVFEGLQSASNGAACGETSLSWSAALETCNAPVSYEVYRSTDPGFVPDPSSRIGSSLSLSFADAALVPGQAYTYVVRARDGAGNEDGNDVRITVGATVLDRVLLEETFDPAGDPWSVVAPNDAVTGNWEIGDPEGTEYQPGDDHTAAPGIECWVTGLAAGGGGGGNDVDTGTTTLLSSAYDLSSAVDPEVRYFRWFTNDLGNAPGEDPLTVEVSNDDGATWTLLEEVGAGTPLDWVDARIPLSGVVTPSAQMRFRFTARDLGDGSLVEAAIDDFRLVDLEQGCMGCALPVNPVGTVVLRLEGDDVVLDWTADPVEATRFVVYELTGTGFAEAVRIGSTTERSFVHEGAAGAARSFYYRVSAVDACGNESALE